jgi:hypothetical protein
MTKKEALLISLFSLKILLDFLSPLRDVNFIVVFFIFFLFAFLNIKNAIKISGRELVWILAFFAIAVIAYIQSGELREFLKFTSLILIYVVTRSIVFKMSEQSIARSAEIILKVFFTFFIANYLLSFAFASPLDRAFFNFEHANLLGSYILTASAFVYSSRKLQIRSAAKLKIFAAAFLSTSTGAVLLASTSLFNPKRINLRNLTILTLLFGVAIVTLYFILQTYLPAYFTKIFGPVTLIYEGKLSDLSALASQGVRIQELGDQYQGSLVWRFYAYYVFSDFIGNQPLASLFFGNGFLGYAKVWEGLMPHNDFILVLIDFGLIGFVMLAMAVTTFSIFVIRDSRILLPLLLVLLLRLLLENNIYSFYITSSLVMNAVLLFHAIKLQSNRVRRNNV